MFHSFFGSLFLLPDRRVLYVGERTLDYLAVFANTRNHNTYRNARFSLSVRSSMAFSTLAFITFPFASIVST